MRKGQRHKASTRRRMSETHKIVQNTSRLLALHSRLSEEIWAERSAAEKEEIFRKISESQKGRKFSKTHLANLRRANSRPRTVEHRRKLSLAKKGKCGRASTPEKERERVRKISEAQRGRTPAYNKFKCLYEGLNGRIHMRSSWERAFARWLDHCGIAWEYEAKSFYVGKGRWNGLTYTPDFYLLDQNEYVELKGWLSPENKRKIKRFRELYADVKLYMFFGPQLLKAKVIPFLGRKVG